MISTILFHRVLLRLYIYIAHHIFFLIEEPSTALYHLLRRHVDDVRSNRCNDAKGLCNRHIWEGVAIH